MPLEVELKFSVANFEALATLLASRGATFDEPQREIDYYYQHPSRDFRATDEAVRLRAVGEENRLTYKGPKLDTETKTRREIECLLGPGERNRQSALEWLEASSFQPIAQVAKTRTPGALAWESREVTVALDSVDGLGEFVELELLAELAEFEPAKAALLSLAAALGLSAPERRGYLQLLLASRMPTAP